MKKIIQIILVSAALLALGWFVKFQFNPESLCKSHSDPKLRRYYYECEPGGFTLKKDTIIEPNDSSRADNLRRDRILFGANTNKHEAQKEQIDEDIFNKYWSCNSEFKNMSKKKQNTVNIYDYCKYNLIQKRQDEFDSTTDKVLNNESSYQQEL